MTFTFLQEEIESLLLFATAPIYLTIVGILQSKHLKIVARLNQKKQIREKQMEFAKKRRHLLFATPLFMLIGALIHLLAYLIFGKDVFRYGYLISVGIMYVIYTLIALINFWMKGAGVLKDIGNFNGLPGN